MLPPSLAESISAVPGLEAQPGADLARHTTLHVGGPAQLLVRAMSEKALIALLEISRRSGAPFLLLGMGSNVLIPDRGVDGIVVRLSGGFGRIRVRSPQVSAGAAVPLPRLARRTAAMGLRGLEALSGFPSTVGGAVFMNAGCYGCEIKDVLVRATVIERDGSRRRLGPADLRPGYRTTVLQTTGGIVSRAWFRLEPGDAAAALARIKEVDRLRRNSLPSDHPNAGSIFKNPPGDFAGRLIEAAGLKGERCGGAQISPKHANVIVNLGGARASDVLTLMIRAHKAVRDASGVSLKPEIVLAGALAQRWLEAVGSEPAVPGSATADTAAGVERRG